MAVGFPTKVNYATGDVLTATNMNDLSGTVNLLESANESAAGVNKIINGDFGIWQRGTSFTPAAANAIVYNADRFFSQRDGTGATVTVSQQTFTPGTAPVAGYEGQFFYRYAQTVAGTGGTYSTALSQSIEDVRTFAGQTVTLSFWAKSPTSTPAGIGFNQNFGSGGSTAVNTQSLPGPTFTTSWARYTATVAIPSITGKTVGTSSYLQFYISAATANTVNTIDIWGVQIEAGSTASDFKTASGGSKQGELAMCQRYYARLGGTAQGAAYSNFGLGYAHSTTAFRSTIYSPTTMRIAPSVSLSGAITTSTQGLTLSGLSGVGGTQTTTSGSFDSTGTAFTQYRPDTLVASNSTAAYIEMSAEL